MKDIIIFVAFIVLALAVFGIVVGMKNSASNLANQADQSKVLKNLVVNNLP